MLEIVVCEDNDKYRELIAETIGTLMSEHKINGSVVLQCASPEAVEAFLLERAPNVYFLDIDLNSKLNGIDLAALIHEKLPDSYIVFISQYANLVFKSFKVRPFDFLPKPMTKADLENVLLEIDQDHLKKNDHERPDFLQIKIGTQLYQIPKSEIIFLEKYGNKCIVHSTRKTVHCYQSLESISEKLEDLNFIRCHKSYIVNRTFISQLNLSEMEILLANGQKCFIGGKYKKNLLLELEKATER